MVTGALQESYKFWVEYSKSLESDEGISVSSSNYWIRESAWKLSNIKDNFNEVDLIWRRCAMIIDKPPIGLRIGGIYIYIGVLTVIYPVHSIALTK